jgi:hypothetical protein
MGLSQGNTINLNRVRDLTRFLELILPEPQAGSHPMLWIARDRAAHEIQAKQAAENALAQAEGRKPRQVPGKAQWSAICDSFQEVVSTVGSDHCQIRNGISSLVAIQSRADTTRLSALC